MVEQNKALVRRLVDGVWVKRDLNVFDAVFSEKFVDHNPMGADPGKAAFKQVIMGFHAAFSEDHTTIEDIIAEGDKVVWRWSYRGKHTGPLMGMPPTGKHVTVSGINIDRIEGGQIVERWHQVDLAGLLKQIGGTPPAGR